MQVFLFWKKKTWIDSCLMNFLKSRTKISHKLTLNKILNEVSISFSPLIKYLLFVISLSRAKYYYCCCRAVSINQTPYKHWRKIPNEPSISFWSSHNFKRFMSWYHKAALNIVVVVMLYRFMIIIIVIVVTRAPILGHPRQTCVVVEVYPLERPEVKLFLLNQENVPQKQNVKKLITKGVVP